MDRRDTVVTDPTLHGYAHICKRLSWGAIIAGALVGVGLGFLLNLFIVAIGLSAFTTNQEGLWVLAAGGYIGLLIGSIAVTFASGYAAGFLGWSCCGRRNWGVLYGFAAWCLALILMVLLGAQFDRYMANYTNFVARPTSQVIAGANPAPSMMAAANTTAENRAAAAPSTRASEQEMNRMGMATFMLFVLFFVGALSSCFGGYFGSAGRERCEVKCQREIH